MKTGARAVGVAESHRAETSTLAAVVCSGPRVEQFAFGTCTVGGSDATTAIASLVETLDREDLQYLLVAGIAPAWFNVIDCHELADATGLPVISVSFEASEGLADAIREAFDDEATVAERLSTYEAQPPRRAVTTDAGDRLFVRSVGLPDETADDVVTTLAQPGNDPRPEPVRVAKLAARAGDRFRADASA